MAIIRRAVTASLSEEVYQKKDKAMFMMKSEGSNLSKEISRLIEDYAKKFDEQATEGGK